MSLLLTFLAATLAVSALTLSAAPSNADTLDTPVFSDTSAVTLTVMAGQRFENRDFVPVAPADLSNVTVSIFYGSWFTTLDIAKDGTISGSTPYAGTIDATLWARNDTTGQYSTRDIHIITRQPAQIIAQPSFSPTVGQTSSTNIYLTGTPTPTLTAEGLPAGLSLTLTNAGPFSTWALSGAPARGTVGSHQVTLRATADAMPDVTQTMTVNVNPANFTTGPAPTLTNVDTPHVGDTLNLDFGNVSTINPGPQSLSYQWFRNGNPILGATASSYQVTADDLGSHLTLAVTAHRFEYNDATGTYTTAAVLPGDQAEPSAPQISGVRNVGHTLSVDPGTATPEADSVTYQWFRSGTLIPGATDASYQLTASDVAATMSAAVTRHRAGYRDKVTTATTDGPVSPGTLDVTPSPTVTGPAQVDQPVSAALDSATARSLSDRGLDATVSYQWLLDGDPIDGAHAATYTPTGADAGHDIAARVTLDVAGYVSVTGTSTGVPVANGTFSSVPVPTISGTAKVGEQLSVQQDPTTPAAEHTSYRWLRDGEPITGATSDTYVVTADDLDHLLAVRTTVTAAGYDAGTVVSAPSDPVELGTLDVTVDPTLEGAGHVGEPLNAALGDATNRYLLDEGLLATTQVTYQWLRDGDPIGDGSGSYTATPADSGHDVSVRVTVTVAGYQPVTVTTGSKHVANGTFASVPSPTITGTAKVGEQLSAHQDATTPAAEHVGYQWLRDGDLITAATGSTYTAVHADLGHRLTVTTTVTTNGYAAATTESEATAKVAPNAAPGLTVTLGQRQLVLGQHTTVTWSATDADTVSMGTTSPAAAAASGTLILKPTRTGHYTYTVTATNRAGTTTATVTLDVALPAATLRVTTNRTLVARRGVVKVTASGLDRGERYTITLAGTRVSSGNASTGGRINRLVRIPKTAPSGTGALVVTGAQANRTGSAMVNVLTAKHLTLNPSSRIVRANHVTSVTVAGLAAGESVVVRYRGVRVSGAHAHANSHGRYAVRFNVRRDWGWRTVTAHGAISTRAAVTKIAVYPSQG